MPRLKFLVAGALIIGAISFLMFSGLSDSMVYYYSVSEVRARAGELAGQGIRVSGFVSPGTIQRSGQSTVRFVVFEKDSDRTLPVVYEGIVPDTFKDQAEVVVEGTYNQEDQLFHANTLLAKCPSKYESQDEHPDDVQIGQESGSRTASN